MPTSAALPATITPHNHARTDTHDATSPTHHNTTSASRGVSPTTAHTCKPRTPHRTLACRIQTHKPRTPARRPAQPQPLRTAQTSLHAHRRTHATHSTVHSSALPTHRPQKITPSHTRRLRATLTAELPGCPALTGCCRRDSWRSSPSTCRTHEQPSRHTMAPDAAADPSQPPAMHLSASHGINQIKSNDKPVSTLHAIAHAQHRARVTPKRRNKTARRYQTPSSHHTSQRHSYARASHNATHSDTTHVQTSARHTTTTTTATTTTTQQLQTASGCREGCTRRTATRRRLTAET
jgi:hypothetical protein